MSFHYCKIDTCPKCGRKVYCVTCHKDECGGMIFENGPLEMFDPDSDHWSNKEILGKKEPWYVDFRIIGWDFVGTPIPSGEQFVVWDNSIHYTC